MHKVSPRVSSALSSSPPGASLFSHREKSLPFAVSAGLKGLLSMPENPKMEISKSFKKTAGKNLSNRISFFRGKDKEKLSRLKSKETSGKPGRSPSLG